MKWDNHHPFTITVVGPHVEILQQGTPEHPQRIINYIYPFLLSFQDYHHFPIFFPLKIAVVFFLFHMPQVVNVTDFDGKFEAKGVPGMGGSSAGDLAKKLKALKPPKRPAQPPKPKLQDVEN